MSAEALPPSGLLKHLRATMEEDPDIAHYLNLARHALPVWCRSPLLFVFRIIPTSRTGISKSADHARVEDAYEGISARDHELTEAADRAAQVRFVLLPFPLLPFARSLL
jgi:hypothetical protein